MTQIDLFDQPSAARPATLRLNRDAERVSWECPHCGGYVTQDADEEGDDDILADPSCAYCRAAYAGVMFSEWRKLPLDVKRTHIPPANFRRVRS